MPAPNPSATCPAFCTARPSTRRSIWSAPGRTSVTSPWMNWNPCSPNLPPAVPSAPNIPTRSAIGCAALDLVRSRQNIRNIPLDELEPVLAEPASRSPERAQHSNEIRDWLRGALARLNPRIAQMFALRFFEGKDNPEIARLLNTTPGTVAVTLSRTRDRLQKEYQAYMGGVA